MRAGLLALPAIAAGTFLMLLPMLGFPLLVASVPALLAARTVRRAPSHRGLRRLRARLFLLAAVWGGPGLAWFVHSRRHVQGVGEWTFVLVVATWVLAVLGIAVLVHRALAEAPRS